MKMPTAYRILTSLLVIAFVATITVSVKATSQEDLDAINQQLEQIRLEREKLQKDLNNTKSIDNQYARELAVLNNEISVLNNKITETDTNILALETEITIAEESIKKTTKLIDKSEVQLAVVGGEVNTSLTDMYIDYKSQENMSLFFSSSSTDLVKLELYSEISQEEMADQLLELRVIKKDLDNSKETLKSNKLTLEKNKIEIVTEREQLEKDKQELVVKSANFYKRRAEVLSQIKSQKDLLAILSDQEQRALAEQTRIEQIIFNNVTQIPSGTYVSAGTVIGSQGCTGLCTGEHVHFMVSNNGQLGNPCSFMAGGGPCGGGGTLSWPLSGSYFLTSSYGYRCIGNYCSMHSAIDIAHSVSGSAVKAAHAGYLSRTFVPCNSSNALCRGGGANVVTICENTNCNSGFKTQYWHLR